MVKLGIFYELDKDGNDTGRVQVAEEGEDGIVYETFATDNGEAEKAMAKLQAEFDMKDKITEEYLKWEKGCLARHAIDKDELRRYLVNVIL